MLKNELNSTKGQVEETRKVALDEAEKVENERQKVEAEKQALEKVEKLEEEAGRGRRGKAARRRRE